MEVHITPLQKRVLGIIQDSPRAANDDAMLTDLYWHQYDGWDDSKSLYYNLSRISPSESITRARRKLHELGLITYTEDVETARYEEFKKYKEEYGR